MREGTDSMANKSFTRLDKIIIQAKISILHYMLFCFHYLLKEIYSQQKKMKL